MMPNRSKKNQGIMVFMQRQEGAVIGRGSSVSEDPCSYLQSASCMATSLDVLGNRDSIRNSIGNTTIAGSVDIKRDS